MPIALAKLKLRSNTTPPTEVPGDLVLGTFLLGDRKRVAAFRQQQFGLPPNAKKRWFFYGQDTWRVTPKFTFNYGLRWEIYFPESVNGKGNGGFANLDQGVIRVAGYDGIGLNGNIANTYKAFARASAWRINLIPKLWCAWGTVAP